MVEKKLLSPNVHDEIKKYRIIKILLNIFDTYIYFVSGN